MTLSLPRFGKIIASVFALLCIVNAISMGSMIQSNAISESLGGVFEVPPLVSGIVLALLGGIIVSRGTEGMAKFTEILVPLMTLGYIVISLAVLIIRSDMLFGALCAIVTDAFSPEATAGGVAGFILSRSLRYGTMRGLISNEAGCGTAPAAHAASNAKSAAEQGFWGIFEVFTDTIILCTMTALVIIVGFEGTPNSSSWIMMTINAYSAVLGRSAAIFLSVAVLCFGFATIVCWAHYGVESVRYLNERRGYKKLFIFIYCASILVGAFPLSEAIWSAADFAIGAMTLINVGVICFMSRDVKQETEDYFARASKRKNKRNRK